LGVAYEKQNNKTKAMESYSRAITVDPSNQLAHDGMSRLRG
jgi:Tfp pilus assembly protein PilF